MAGELFGDQPTWWEKRRADIRWLLTRPVYLIGKHSPRFRAWYHKRTGKFCWGLTQFINDQDWK